MCTEARAVFNLINKPGFSSVTIPDPSFFTLENLVDVTCEMIAVGDTNRLYAFDQAKCSCYDPGENQSCTEAEALYNLVQSGYCSNALSSIKACNEWTVADFESLSVLCSFIEYYDASGNATGEFYSFQTDGTNCACVPPTIDPPCTEAQAVCDFVGSIGQAAWDESLQNFIPYMTCEELSSYDPVCSYFNENIVGGTSLGFDQNTCSCYPDGGGPCTETKAILNWANSLQAQGVTWNSAYQNGHARPMPWNLSPLAVCSNFNAMNDLGMPLLYDSTNCICYSPCDYEHDPSHYQFDQCPYFMGGLHWNGCKMWLTIGTKDSDTCAASDDVNSVHEIDAVTENWRFYDDLAWRAANDANPAQTMNEHPLVAS